MLVVLPSLTCQGLHTDPDVSATETGVLQANNSETYQGF